MTPDISIIIAAYNVEAYIERAIRSALAQEGVSVEVIVADDASTDGTLAVARGIKDARVSVIAQQKNAGPGATRNAALALAKAPWLAVLDGDDEMEAGRLARCLKRAEETQADIVVDNLTVRREADGAEYLMFAATFFVHTPKLSLADFIAGNCSFLGGAALGYVKPVFSRAFLQKHGLVYDTELRIGEDYLLLAEALAEGAVCVREPSAGYIYTARTGSTSHRMTLNDVRRIEAGDQKFLSRHVLTGQAVRAQRLRTRRLHDAFAFTNLVDALKAKNFAAAFKLAATRPAILWYLWRPVVARVGRKRGLR